LYPPFLNFFLKNIFTPDLLTLTPYSFFGGPKFGPAYSCLTFLNVSVGFGFAFFLKVFSDT
jgi:hypothetical protein